MISFPQLDLFQIEDSSDFSEHVWPVLKETHEWKSSSLTLEKIWLLLAVREKFPEALSKRWLQDQLGRKKLVTTDLCVEVSKARDACTLPFHVARRHPVYPTLFSSLEGENLLDVFWQHHVDVSKASSYKAMLAFALLPVVLDSLEDKTKAPKFLTRGVVETSLHFLSRVESPPEEDEIILSVLAKFVDVAKEHPECQIPVIKALLTDPGSITFDKTTGSSIVNQLVCSSGPDAVKYVANLYREAFLGEGGTRTSQQRVFSAHQLAKLVGHPAMADDLEWREDTLNFLLVTSLFDPKDKVVAPIGSLMQPLSREARNEVKEVFFKALDFKAKNLEHLCSLLKSTAKHANTLFASKVSTVLPFSGSARSAWNNMMATVEDIESARGEKKKEAVFQVLFLQMGFQLLVEPEMAMEMLDELRECKAKSRQKSAKKKKAKKAKQGEEEDEPQWVEVVVDLLISLQSQNKHVLRQLANSVFVMLCPHMTEVALQTILDVINPPEAKEGDADGDDEEGSDDDWEDMEEEGDEDDDNDENDKEDDEEDDEDEDEEDEDDQDQEESSDKAEALKTKLKAALGDQAPASDDDDTVSWHFYFLTMYLRLATFSCLSGLPGHGPDDG